MSSPETLKGSSRTSFAEAAQAAVDKIEELPGDQTVTYNVASASVAVGGVLGGSQYDVTLRIVRENG